MRRSLFAVHVVALAIWLGALAASFLLAPTLFVLARPVCPACLRTTKGGEALLACASCGALHHAACARAGCFLAHGGDHRLVPPSSVASVASTSLGRWERVVRAPDENVSAERRLLWRLEATSAALSPERGEVPGACFELPREAAGDALARAFPLAQVIAVGMGIVALLTVLLTPPGGMLRLLRTGALVGALAVAAASLGLARDIATKRLPLEAATVASAEDHATFDRTHHLASGVGVAEAVLVVVALVLALERREKTA